MDKKTLRRYANMRLSEIYNALDNGHITQEEFDAIGAYQTKNLTFKRFIRRIRKWARSEKGKKFWQTILGFVSGVVATLLAQYIAFKLGWQ